MATKQPTQPETAEVKEISQEAEIKSETAEVIIEKIELPDKKESAAPVYNAAMDPKKSHKERILAFLDGKSGFVKLNDFLKSLFGLPTPGVPPVYTQQAVMKKLKLDLLELEAERKVVFKDEHFKRLGKHHFPDQSTGRTHYFNITNIPIEAKLA